MKTPRAPAGSSHDGYDGADTVERFAAKNAISRAQAYKEITAGRLIARKVGARTIITREDAARWRRALPKIPANGTSNTRGLNGLPPLLANARPEGNDKTK
jgi:hypothetical protein